jgi:single-strand DNA-binding protein
MQEKTEWHRLVVWNSNFSKLADIAERYCKKGDKIYVEGSLEYRTYQDKEGQTKYMTEIRVNELILLSGRGGEVDAEGGSPRMAAASAPRKAKEGSVDEFPEALDAEDDDLPF